MGQKYKYKCVHGERGGPQPQIQIQIMRRVNMVGDFANNFGSYVLLSEVEVDQTDIVYALNLLKF